MPTPQDDNNQNKTDSTITISTSPGAVVEPVKSNPNAESEKTTASTQTEKSPEAAAAPEVPAAPEAAAAPAPTTAATAATAAPEAAAAPAPEAPEAPAATAAPEASAATAATAAPAATAPTTPTPTPTPTPTTAPATPSTGLTPKPSTPGDKKNSEAKDKKQDETALEKEKRQREQEASRRYYAGIQPYFELTRASRPDGRLDDEQQQSISDTTRPTLGPVIPIKITDGIWNLKLRNEKEPTTLIATNGALSLATVPGNKNDFIREFGNVMRAYTTGLNQSQLVLSFPNVEDPKNILPERIEWMLEAAKGKGVSIEFDEKIQLKLAKMLQGSATEKARAQAIFDAQNMINAEANKHNIEAKKSAKMAEDLYTMKNIKDNATVVEKALTVFDKLTDKDKAKIEEQIALLEKTQKELKEHAFAASRDLASISLDHKNHRLYEKAEKDFHNALMQQEKIASIKNDNIKKFPELSQRFEDIKGSVKDITGHLKKARQSINAAQREMTENTIKTRAASYATDKDSQPLTLVDKQALYQKHIDADVQALGEHVNLLASGKITDSMILNDLTRLNAVISAAKNSLNDKNDPRDVETVKNLMESIKKAETALDAIQKEANETNKKPVLVGAMTEQTKNLLDDVIKNVTEAQTQHKQLQNQPASTSSTPTPPNP